METNCIISQPHIIYITILQEKCSFIQSWFSHSSRSSVRQAQFFFCHTWPYNSPAQQLEMNTHLIITARLPRYDTVLWAYFPNRPLFCFPKTFYKNVALINTIWCWLMYLLPFNFWAHRARYKQVETHFRCDCQGTHASHFWEVKSIHRFMQPFLRDF